MKQSPSEDLFTCSHCEEKCRPIIQNKKLISGDILNLYISDGKILFILEGSLSVSYETIKKQDLFPGEMILIPPSCHLRMTAKENCTLVILRTDESINFCNGIPLEVLYNKLIDRTINLHLLQIKPPIHHFLKTFPIIVSQKKECDYYFNLKVRELFYLLMTYYSTAELVQFLSPILSNNNSFLYFVYRNHNKVKTAQELAALFGISLSAFEKQFHKTFGVPVYQWMLQKKVRRIYHELKCSNQSLREIATEYGFSSHTQFNDFCKKHLGETPGKLRELS